MYGLNIVAHLVFVAVVVRAYQWPSPRYDALETLLFEGRRYDGSNLASLQHPCRNRGSSQASIGAEWLRLAYHDAATHDAQKGTGGLDASIAYELDRAGASWYTYFASSPLIIPQNSGLGMIRSLEDFYTYSSKYISRADVIAIGATFAVASCGGPILHFRGGRVDALTANTNDVPQPDQDLATHTANFQRQGFSPEEMISLVACGHTMGGVTSSDNPRIVLPGPDPAVENVDTFDSTGQFDNVMVTEYLAGRSRNPLVTVANVTLASDLRIFGSDNNATMRTLAAPDTYSATCGSLLERMLEAVPANVTLTDEITLLPAKVSSAHLTVEHQQLVFKLSFRLLQAINTTVSNKRVVTLLWCDRYGDAQGCKGNSAKSALAASKSVDEPFISPVTVRMGYYFSHYNFVVPIAPDESISTFWLTVDEGDGSKRTTYNNGGDGYLIQQDNILYVPMTSSSVFNGGAYTSTQSFSLVSAIKSSVSPSRVYMSAFDSAMPHYESPLNQDIDMVLNTTFPAAAGYVFYTGEVDDRGAQLTVDMHAVIDGVTYTEDYLQTYFLSSKLAYTPPTKVTAVDISAAQSHATSGSPRSRGIRLSFIALCLVATWCDVTRRIIE